MATFDIRDSDGEWFVGMAPLSVRDPETSQFYHMNQPVKAKKTDWMQLQINAGVIVSCADPTAPAAPPAPPPPPDKAGDK